MAPPLALLGSASRPLWGPQDMPGLRTAGSAFGTTRPPFGTPLWADPVVNQFPTVGPAGASPASHGAPDHAVPPGTGAAFGPVGMTSHHASPIGTGSNYTAEFAQRQDTAEAKAAVLEDRVMTMADDTATAMRELMTGMREGGASGGDSRGRGRCGSTGNSR